MSLLLSKRCFHARINLGQLLKCWLSYCWREYLCYNVLTRRTRSKSWIQKFSLNDFAGLTIRKLINSWVRVRVRDRFSGHGAAVWTRRTTACVSVIDIGDHTACLFSVFCLWLTAIYNNLNINSAYRYATCFHTEALNRPTNPPHNGTSPRGRRLMREHEMPSTLSYIKKIAQGNVSAEDSLGEK